MMTQPMTDNQAKLRQELINKVNRTKPGGATRKKAYKELMELEDTINGTSST